MNVDTRKLEKICLKHLIIDTMALANATIPLLILSFGMLSEFIEKMHLITQAAKIIN